MSFTSRIFELASSEGQLRQVNVLIFMTCIVGSYPIISIPNRGFSFRFYNDEDYDKLLDMLTNFLNHASLDEKLQNLRNDLRRTR